MTFFKPGTTTNCLRNSSSGFLFVTSPKDLKRTLHGEALLPSRGHTEGHKAELRAHCEEAHVQSNWEHMKPTLGYFDLLDHSGPAIGPNMRKRGKQLERQAESTHERGAKQEVM